MRPSLKSDSQARVTMLLTDPIDYSKKMILQFSRMESVNSGISMTDTGSATVSFSNPKLKFFRGVLRPAWAREQAGEVSMLKEALQKFSAESGGDSNLKLIENYIINDRILVPFINPLDFMWIDYRGRDGIWYPGFSGMVTNYSEVIRAGTIPTFTITAKDYRRVFQFSPIVIGLNNYAQLRKLDTKLTELQIPEIATSNIFSNKGVSTIYKKVLEVVCGNMNIASDTDPGFWRFRGASDSDGKIGGSDDPFLLFQGGKVIGDSIVSEGSKDNRAYASPYSYSPVEFSLLGHSRNIAKAPASAFYKNPLGFAFYDDVFEEGKNKPTIYNLVIRQMFDMWAIETETAQNILSKLANATMSFIYADALGNIRHEFPRFAGVPSLDKDAMAYGYKHDSLGRMIQDKKTPCHALNYWLSSRDQSFMDYKFTVDEAEMVATRVQVNQSYAFGQIQVDPSIQRMSEMTGASVSSDNDLLKYGLRSMNIEPFFGLSFIPQGVMNRYAKAIQMAVNSRNKTFTVSLRQRADTQLNRTMVFSDKGHTGLIMNITDTYSKAQGHTRMHTCRFVRLLGEKIQYPWGDVLLEPLETFDDTGDLVTSA